MKIFPVREVRDFQGAVVPWEVEGYAEDYRRAESSGGVFDLSDWETIAIQGPDAKDFLQRMSTVDFRKFTGAEARHGAFLTGRGQIVALGQFLEGGGGFHLFVAPPQGEYAAEHLLKYHFQERLEVRYASSEWAHFALWNPTDSVKRALGMGHREIAAHQLHTAMPENLRFEVWRDDSRHSLWWVRIKRSSGLALLKWLHDVEVFPLGRRLFEFYRIRSGVPQVGIECSDKQLILETGFDQAVARNKGCYPGQEVVERIFTYGQVNRKLVPVEVTTTEAGVFPKLPVALEHEGKEVGSLVSLAEMPEDRQRAVGLAYVHRLHWDRREPFAVDLGTRVTIRTT